MNRLFFPLLLLLIATIPLEAKPAKKISEFTKGATLVPGYFTLYTKEHKYYLELDMRKLGKDFLLSASVAEGLGQNGIFAGTLINAKVAQFQKVQDTIRLVFRDVYHRSSRDKQLKKAVELAFRDSIHDSYPILAQQGMKILIDATPIIGGDLYYMAGWVSRAHGPVSFNPKLSYVESVKNFSQNTEVRTRLAYTESLPGRQKRSLSILMHYSFFPIPKNSYRPRKADQRVGNFLTAIKDYSIQDHRDNFVRYINRWHLEKADPGSSMSLPKEPIVYYLASTIPLKYRKYVRAGVLEWNKAFEKIGFLGAIEARVQAKSDTWDMEDNRYHVISWIASEKASYGAIGPSRVNPMTGQILDADILFDESRVRGAYLKFKGMVSKEDSPKKEQAPTRHIHDSNCDVYEVAAEQIALLLLAQDREKKARVHSQAHPKKEKKAVVPSKRRPYNVAPGGVVPGVKNEGDASSQEDEGEEEDSQEEEESSETEESEEDNEKEDSKEEAEEKTQEDPGYSFAKLQEEYIGQLIKWIIMHEVGHTLGFRHNFKASTLHPNEKLHDKELVEKMGLYNSVMEYPGINIHLDPSKQGYFYTPTLGPYDYWAVEYSYSTLSPKMEAKKLAEIAKKGAQKELAYATDEDTRSKDGSDIDPFTNLYDLGSDPLAYAEDSILFIQESWNKILDRMVADGQNYVDASDAYLNLVNTYIRSLRFIAKYVGGKEFLRIHKGDTDKSPLTPVSFDTQRRALELLNKYAFDASALQIPSKLAESMPNSRWSHWGMDTWGAPIDKNIHKIIAYVQKQPFERLFLPRVLERVIDQEQLYLDEKNVLGLEEVFRSLTNGIFTEVTELPNMKDPEFTRKTPWVNSHRRELQRAYIQELFELNNLSKRKGREIPYDAKTVARYFLEEIVDSIDTARSHPNYTLVDSMSRIHMEDTRNRIRLFLDSPYSNRNY